MTRPRKYILYCCTVLICIVGGFPAFARSVHRTSYQALPSISVRWAGDSRSYLLQSSHLEFHPFFGVFDKEFFNEHVLPSGAIPYRNHADQSVSGATLDSLIEKLLKEIHKKKKSYKDFIILTNKNFNRKKECGMMVLKFKEYPFILKLCIETPKTFTNPYCKGLDNVWFFPLGGGINRHLAGLTRIKNMEETKKKLAQHPQWSTMFDLPRKWHWMPNKQSWLEITGSNIGGMEKVTTQIPGTYCIVADAIESKGEFSIFNSEHTKMALDLCNYLNMSIDPHINNFMIEKETDKIVIVDTEHFPSVVGLKEKMTFDSYISWYAYLLGKCIKDWFFRTKQERLLAQQIPPLWGDPVDKSC